MLKMANNSKGKALANPAATSATNESLTKNRIEWTMQEENFLLAEVSSRKVDCTSEVNMHLNCALTNFYLLLGYTSWCA